VTEILDTGLSQQDVAVKVREITGNKHFSQATVSRIKDGAATSYAIGQALEKIHGGLKGRARARA